MKSQSQLQQQAVAAAMAKKSGQHGAVGRRRLRRNVDVVVNAMKNRSQSSTNQPASIVPGSQGTTTSQGINIGSQQQSQLQPQQYPFVNMPYYHRKQLANQTSGSSHSHSQQVLDNSQAIQHKINMYSNQANTKSTGKQLVEHSPPQNKPSLATTTQGGSSKVVPSQLSRAYLSQRSNQTPNPQTQQPQMYTNTGNAANNIQVQLQHMMVNRRVPTDRTHQVQQQNLYQANNMYSDSIPIQGGIGSHSKITHQVSTQNLEPIPRSQSQLAGTGKGFVQIKGQIGQVKQNRNAAYGGTLTQRQKSSKKLNPNNTLYSQISLKEIPSPGKPYKVGSKVAIAKLSSGPALHVAPRAASQKYALQQPVGNQGQNFVSYHQQPMQPTSHDAYISDGKDIQSLIDAVPQQDGSSLNQRNHSRNFQNVVSTNGVTHAQHQGAILNINTASDINIYNNAFIVQGSPSNGQINAVTNQQVQQQQQIRNGGSEQKRQIGKYGQQNNLQGSGIQGGQGQRKRNAQGMVNTQQQQQFLQAANHGQSRSKSTGRNQNKSANNSRVGGGNQGTGVQGTGISKTSRAQAINEAYSSNQTYLINNKHVMPAMTQATNHQLQPHQLQGGQQQITPQQIQQRFELQQRDGQIQGQIQQPNVYNQIQNQQPGKHIAHHQKLMSGSGKIGYNSTENIKRSEDSSLTGVANTTDQRTNSLTRPFYNNLVNDSLKRSSFGASNNLGGGTKRNFKSVKNQKDAMNAKQMQEIANASKRSIGALSNFQKNPQLSLQDRANDLIRRGRAKIKNKEYNEAIKLLSEILETFDPSNTEAIFYRAVSYLDQGNLQQAISELWRVVELRTTTGAGHEELCQQAYILLSIAHKRLGESQNALQDLELCIDIFPEYDDAYLARGQALLHQELFNEALSDFEKFIDLNTSPFSGYLGVGDCYKALKRYSDASKAYTKAIKLLPQQKSKPNYEHLFQQCYMKRGLSGYHEGKNNMALSDLQSVIQKDSSNVKAHYYIGKLLAKGTENEHSQQTDAILHFEQVAKYHDQEFYYGNAMFQMAKLRLRQKAYYEAFHCLKRAADNNFSSKRLSMYKDFTEGVLYLIKRKIKKGVQILSDLLEILVNKDKSKKKDETQEDQAELTQNTIDNPSKRKAKKAHSDYLIHQILIFRAYGYVAIEKYELAQDDIRRVSKYGKVDAATTYNKWLGKGILRMDHEDYLMASKFFTKAWKKFPPNKDPYCLQVISIVRSYTFSLGGYFMDQHIKYDKVLETKKFMDKAITNCCKQTPEASLYFFRGLLNFQMHNFLEALNDFNLAIEAEEESSAQFYLARGRTYACLCVLNEAMKDLSVALNLDETLQQAYIYRGKCAYLIGDNNLAFLDFQRLILTDPKNPMVHVYAGNLLMTTGAYQDAIKAYENADTVEPTCISAFQRVRCFCALSDLDHAKKMMDETKRMQPDDVLLNFDSLCLDELIKVGQVTNKVSKGSLTAADVKTNDNILKNAISTFDELIETYSSERLIQLKRRDSQLNVQIIPNVQRVRLEKVVLAQEIARKKEQLSEEQKQDLPTLSVDLDEPVNLKGLKKHQAFSYYYENIFNLEDFFLYRAVFKFHQHRYADAVKDFEEALRIYRDNRNDQQANRPPGANQGRQVGTSGFNTRNHTLQHYSIGHRETGVGGDMGTSLQSNQTDLSDIGLSSFNELEITYNIFLCYLMIGDRSNALGKLNELQRKSSKRYSAQIPLVRIIALDKLGETEKAIAEIQRLQKQNNDLFKATFGSQQQKGADNAGFLVELFPSESRLCAHFASQSLTVKSKTGKGFKLRMRLSFSMPFVKPPNMIPNVDEDCIQSEFNLKQIDAPMPEAPWIKRCEHGILFTNQLNKEHDEDREKYLKFFSSKPKQDKQQRQQHQLQHKRKTSRSVAQLGNSDQNGAQFGNGDLEDTVVSTRTRLLNNMVAETLSDRNKISLIEESNSPRIINEEDTCQEVMCQNDCVHDMNVSRESDEVDDVEEHTLSEQVNMQDQQESEESYDSEDMVQKGRAEMMAIRASGKLIKPERDSLVNMGENLKKNNIKEIKRMKKEIVQPNLSPRGGTKISTNELLPKFEESKAPVAGAAKGRYAEPDEIDEVNVDGGIIVTESGIDSQGITQKMLVASQQLEKARQSEPHRLNDAMLAGQRLKERRVSNLSLSELELGDSPESKQHVIDTTKPTKQMQAQKQQAKRSKFRTSIDVDDDQQ